MKKKLSFFIVLIIALAMTYTAIFGVNFKLGDSQVKILGGPDMRYGIDIRGGVNAVFEPIDLDRKPTSQELEAARAIIEVRLDQKNIMDRDVTIDAESGHVIVNFPWKADETDFNPETAIAELGDTAQLTFQDAAGNVLFKGSHVKNSKPILDQRTKRYGVSLTFDDEGTKLFANATKKLVGKTISIYMDETLIQSANVMEAITTGEAQITNMESYDYAKSISDKINSGALPFSLITKNYSTISPTLGAEALHVMLMAGLIAYIIIAILLITYYRLPGFVASISLLIQISGQILSLSIPQMTLTLTGIAGIILSIGMGVDANVIISERISEEIKAGKSVSSAIATGFKNAFSSVFDGNITVLIVAVILMIFGSGSLLSFAYSLFTGIVFNFVAGVTASRIMIKSLSSYDGLKNPKLFTCLSRRVTAGEDKIIPFYRKQNAFFGLSTVLMVVGIIFMFINGVQLDIQFKGGSVLKYAYTGTVDENIAGDIATDLLDRPVTTQLTTDIKTGENRLVFNLAGKYGIDAKVQQDFDASLKESFPDSEITLSESTMVEAYLGQRFLRNGLIAIVLAAILVMLYVWARFKLMGGMMAGFTAIVALLHDVLIVFFTCVIFQIPIGDNFVAVVLSIIGYSINDTIVIYDRIRENSQAYPDMGIESLADLSITQSMTRSINTNVAVLISVSLVYILAFANSIESIQSFALPMAIGSISGCYSTICIAGPLWAMLKKKKGDSVSFAKATE